MWDTKASRNYLVEIGENAVDLVWVQWSWKELERNGSVIPCMHRIVRHLEYDTEKLFGKTGKMRKVQNLPISIINLICWIVKDFSVNAFCTLPLLIPSLYWNTMWGVTTEVQLSCYSDLHNPESTCSLKEVDCWKYVHVIKQAGWFLWSAKPHN